MKKYRLILIALAIVILCAAFVPRKDLPEAPEVEPTQSPAEVAAWIAAVKSMGEIPEYIDDDNDCAFYEGGECVEWTELDEQWRQAEEDAYMEEYCKNLNYWQPGGLSDCPKPDWVE